MKNKYFTAVLILIMATLFVLTACSNSNESSDGSSVTTGESHSTTEKEEAQASSSKKKTFVIAHAMAEDTCFGAMTDAMQEVLEASSLFEVQVYPAAQLGSDTEMIQACQSGNITMCPTYTGTYSSFSTPFFVFDKMFAFDNPKVGRAIAEDREFLAILNEEIQSSGLYCLGFGDMEFRKLSTNKEIHSLNDLSGLKVRVVENPIYLSAWSAIGTSPTPMSFTELYSGLQQGVIDAQENTPTVTYSCKAYEVQNYIIDSNHLFHFIALNINLDWYNSLTEEERIVVEEAALAGIEACQEATDTDMEKQYEIFEEAGCHHVGMDEELRKEIIQLVEPTWSEVENRVSAKLYQAYNDAIQRAEESVR